MRVCKSDNPNDKFTANDLFNKEIRSQCYMFMKNISGTAAQGAFINTLVGGWAKWRGPKKF